MRSTEREDEESRKERTDDMKKEEAIAALERLKEGTSGVVAATISDCQRVIGELEDDAGWIPVTERLPEPETEVMVLNRSCCYDGRIRTRVSQSRMYLINGRPVWPLIQGWTQTHWMTLPEIPKEVTEGTE